MPTDTKYMIQQCAQIGTLVYYMNQSNTAPIAEPGPWGTVQDGYCAGLTVRWIRLTYAGKDFVPVNSHWDDVSMKYFNGTDWQATMYQNQLGNYSNANTTTRLGRCQFALGLAQMMVGDIQDGSESLPANAQRLSRVIAKSYGNYYTSLGGPDGNHAIAFRHARPKSGSGPGEFHIFDPNYGHFMWSAPAANWPTVIDWYLQSTGYSSDYTSAYFISRATPPVNHGHA
jgi:hypothetical protein